MTLNVASALALPDDAITQTFGIIARRGAGKTYTGKVLAEEMVDAGAQVVVVDPIGVWWGLRSTSSGRAGGLPVTILGGAHGDLPLESTAGKLIADVVTTTRTSFVLDLSGFESKAQQVRFTTDFAERLYRAKAAQTTPLHLLVDEADEFAPQKPMRDEARMLGAWEALVRRGRARGIGCTLITQRPAVLNKNVLTQIECLVVMQITAPQDRKAIDEWVRGHATDDERDQVAGSLAALHQGEAWWWSPSWLGTLTRTKVRHLRTYDSSRTPGPGEQPVSAQLATVDLDALREQMAATVAEVEANDPKRLKARIRELERERAKPAAEAREVCIEVPVLTAEDRTVLSALGHDVGGAADQAIAAAKAMREAFAQITDRLDGILGRLTAPASAPRVGPARAPATARRAPDTHDAAVTARPATLGKRERAILSVLAQYPQGRTQRQIALLTGYSAKASTIGAGLSNLRKAGYIVGTQITDDGLAALGDDYEPLPTGGALLEHWRAQLGGRERALLDVLIARYPEAVTLAEMATATGYSPEASTIGAGMSKLRGLELADGWRVSADFMDAIRG